MAMSYPPRIDGLPCNGRDGAGTSDMGYFNWRLALALLANAAVWAEFSQMVISRI